MTIQKKIKITPAVVAVACGIACALCVYIFMQSLYSSVENTRSEALARFGGEQVEIVVATRDIAAGESVDSSAVQTKLWLADLLPQTAISDVSEVVGKQTTSSIVEGEVVTSKRFESSVSTLEVPDGLTAVSLPAKEVAAVGGAITPGCKVNMYATGDAATTLLAKDTLVLATSSCPSGESSTQSSSSTSKASTSSGSTVSWITVAVAPGLVEELVAAAQKTQLYFTLPSETSAKETK